MEPPSEVPAHESIEEQTIVGDQKKQPSKTKGWHVPVSKKAQNTHNPIRKIVDGIDRSKVNPAKTMIPLSLGDPCAFGNLHCPDTLVESLVKAIRYAQS